MASKHRDIGLTFRHRSTPNIGRVTKNVGFFLGRGGVPYIYIYIALNRAPNIDCYWVGAVPKIWDSTSKKLSVGPSDGGAPSDSFVHRASALLI